MQDTVRKSWAWSNPFSEKGQRGWHATSRYLPIIKKVVVVILIIGVAFAVILQPNDDTKGLPDAIWGRPVQFKDDSVMPNSGIEQVVSDGQRVYVLFTSRNGVLQVYDYSGTYLYSVRLYAHSNGAFAMAVEGNTLYIQDYHGDIYVFKNGEFTEFLKDDAADAIRDRIPYSNFEKNTEGYEIRKGSVWRIDGESQTCIVNRPAQTGIYQNNVDKLVTVFVLAGFALVCWYFRKKRTS